MGQPTLLTRAAERARRWQKTWPLLLGAVYLALIPVLNQLEEIGGVTYLLLGSTAGTALLWYARYPAEPRGFLATGREIIGAINDWRLGREPDNAPRPASAGARWTAALDFNMGFIRNVPSVIVWLPLPAALSWVGAVMARVNPVEADYYTAFALWAASVLLFLGLVSAAAILESRPSLRALVRSIPRPEAVAVLVIGGAAFAARFIDLDKPGPLWNDEGFDGSKGLEIIRGVRENFLEIGFGSEVSDVYYATLALSIRIFGASVEALRLPSTIVGTVTVILFYFLMREMFDRRVALVGAAFMAVYHFHVHFTRIAFHNGYDTFFATFIFLFGFRAIRTRALLDFALAGLGCGLLFYFFSGARLVPVVFVGVLALVTIRTKGSFPLRNYWGLAMLFAGFVVAFLPVALYFDQFPDRFSSRFESQSIFGEWMRSQVEATGHSELHIVWDQIQLAFGVLFVYKDVYQHYNAQVPLLDAVSAAFFVVGGVYALFHITQPRFFALLAYLLLIVLSLGAFVGPPIATQRYLGTVVVSSALVAVGLVVTADAVAKVIPVLRRYLPVAVAAVVAVIAYMNLSFYFDDYVQSNRYGGGRHLDVAQVADQLEAYDDSYALYWLVGPGFNPRDGGIRFREKDKVLVDVWEDGTMANTFYKGTNYTFGEEAARARLSKPNAVFVVEVTRLADLDRIKALCPGGETSEEWVTPDGLNRYFWHEPPGGRSCIQRLQGVVLLEL